MWVKSDLNFVSFNPKTFSTSGYQITSSLTTCGLTILSLIGFTWSVKNRLKAYDTYVKVNKLSVDTFFSGELNMCDIELRFIDSLVVGFDCCDSLDSPRYWFDGVGIYGLYSVIDNCTKYSKNWGLLNVFKFLGKSRSIFYMNSVCMVSGSTKG